MRLLQRLPLKAAHCPTHRRILGNSPRHPTRIRTDRSTLTARDRQCRPTRRCRRAILARPIHPATHRRKATLPPETGPHSSPPRAQATDPNMTRLNTATAARALPTIHVFSRTALPTRGIRRHLHRMPISAPWTQPIRRVLRHQDTPGARPHLPRRARARVATSPPRASPPRFASPPTAAPAAHAADQHHAQRVARARFADRRLSSVCC